MRWMGIVKRAALICSFTCALSLGESVAYADNASAAEQLFQEGLAAMQKTDYATACEAFAGSNRADPSPGTQINLALCYEKQKKWASAWAWYRSAAGLAEQRGQAERVALANKEAERVKPQIHYVVISVKPPIPDGLVVKRDGEEVTTTLGGKELPLPFDPGEHAIEVSARGKKTFSTKLKTLDSASTERFEVPPLVDAPEGGGGGGGTGGVGTKEQPGPVIVTNDGSGQRTVGIVVGGAGILAGLAAIGVFILAKNEDSKGKDLRADAKAAEQRGDANAAKNANGAADTRFSAAKNNQLIAIVAGAGGVVLIGVGAFLYLTAPKGSSSSGKTRVLPTFGPDYAGFAAAGTF